MLKQSKFKIDINRNIKHDLIKSGFNYIFKSHKVKIINIILFITKFHINAPFRLFSLIRKLLQNNHNTEEPISKLIN